MRRKRSEEGIPINTTTTLSAQVKSRLNLVDMLIEDGYDLRKEGADRYSCRCPFHHEKTPSFKVDESFQRYKCFGCGESGDSIMYFAKQNALEYRTATLLLAEKLGVPLNNHQSQKENYAKQTRLLKLTECIYTFYRQEFDKLDNTHPAKKNILNRSLHIENYEEYFGYAPYNGDQLIKYIEDRGFTKDELRELGHINEKGNVQLKNRLIFTIKNYMGNPIGFSGRELATTTSNGGGGHKYVNSKNSDIFNKSRVAFNIDKAKKKAKALNQVYIVEGQFDVMAMIQKGYENTIALSGTSFTKEHIYLLDRMISPTGQIILCLDGDNAGKKAALKIFKENPNIQLRLHLILLPKNQDPCEYLKDNTSLPKSVRAVDYFMHMIAKKYPPNLPENRREYIEAIQEEITKYIEDKPLKEICLKIACSRAGLEYAHLTQKSAIINKQEQKTLLTQQEGEYATRLTREDRLYMKCIAIYLKHKKILSSSYGIQETDYPHKFRPLIKELISLDKDCFITPELIQSQPKLMTAILNEEVSKVEDNQSAQEYYLSILQQAHQETLRLKKENQKAGLIALVVGKTGKEFVDTLAYLEKNTTIIPSKKEVKRTHNV